MQNEYSGDTYSGISCVSQYKNKYALTSLTCQQQNALIHLQRTRLFPYILPGKY